MKNLEKECFECRETKHLTDFYKHSQMADGHLNKCRECVKADVKARRKAIPLTMREYERKRGKTARRKAQVKARTKRHRANNPEKYKARTAVGNALRDGRLFREPCETCGAEKVHAHHDDYSKPLEVRWFCEPCHKAHHKKED